MGVGQRLRRCASLFVATAEEARHLENSGRTASADPSEMRVEAQDVRSAS